MIKNNLMNILANNQTAFDKAVGGDNVLPGQTGGVDALLDNQNALSQEFMAELNKQMTSEDSLNIENLLAQVDGDANAAKQEINALANQNNQSLDQVFNNQVQGVQQEVNSLQNTEAQLAPEQIQALQGNANKEATPGLNEILGTNAEEANIETLTAKDGTQVERKSMFPSKNQLQKLHDAKVAKFNEPVQKTMDQGLPLLESSEDFILNKNFNNKIKPQAKINHKLSAKLFDANTNDTNFLAKKMMQTSVQNIQSMTKNGKTNVSMNSQDSIFDQIASNAGEMTSEFDMTMSAQGKDLNNLGNVLHFEKPNLDMNSMNVSKAGQTFEMSSMMEMNDVSQDEVMAKISDYIVQSRVAGSDKVDFNANHHDLGQFQISVEKSVGDTVNIQITPKTLEGMQFFQGNRGELLSTLSNNGVNVGEFRLDSNSSDSQSQSGSNNFGQNGNQKFGSESGQRDSESQRRKDLWEAMNREVA